MVSAPSATALALIGEDVSVTASDANGPILKNSGVGRVVDVEATGSTVDDDDGRWPGVRFKIQRPDRTTFWTVTFADKGHR